MITDFPNGGICPGCGRCRHCGQPAPYGLPTPTWPVFAPVPGHPGHTVGDVVPLTVTSGTQFTGPTGITINGNG